MMNACTRINTRQSIGNISKLCCTLVMTMLGACGGGGSSSSSDPTTGNVAGIGSANVGAGGGSVTTTDSRATVVIPPGALTTSTPIAAARSSAPAASAAVGDYLITLSPDGTTFGAPAKLSVQIDSTTQSDEWAIDGLQLAFWSNGQWVPVPTSVATSSSALEGQINHFSTWAIVPRGGSNSSPDYTWEKNEPTCTTAMTCCLRTTNAEYNSRLNSLASVLLGTSPTNSVGCVTGVYLEDGYSMFFSSLRNHAGIDLRAPEGTPVYAPFDGKVKFQALNAAAKASTLTIESTNSSTPYRLLLLHCQSHELVRGSQTIVNPPAVGADVRRGDRICLTGKIGAGAPHLHVELKRIGQDLDNLLGMSGSRGVCKTSSFPDGWNRPTLTYTKATTPGCTLSDIRQNTIDPTTLVAPRVTSITPGAATTGEATIFTIAGENLPLTAVMSLVDGSCSSPTNQTGGGFSTSCTPGASAGSKGIAISTAAIDGVVIDSSRAIMVTSAPSSTTIFLDNFDGNSLDAAKWSVSTVSSTCCGTGNPATYAVSGGYLNIAVPGGSCGLCGIPDGSIFTPKISALSGDFEVYVSFEELTRTSRDGTGPMNLATLEVSNGSTTAGVYVVGDVLNNSGMRGHNIYAFAGGAVLNAGTRILSVGKFYSIEFRVRRISGVFYLAYKVAGDINWTETSYSGIAPSIGMTPKFTTGAYDGGGTRTNSSSTLRIDSFSIKK
jgi:murein DD-endopeptidase MepM/ murein hydrolase activator NlpD